MTEDDEQLALAGGLSDVSPDVDFRMSIQCTRTNNTKEKSH